MHPSLAFWAKTFPSSPDSPAFKPVLHHLLDVAAVAATYLRLHPARCAREAARSGLAMQEYATAAAFLAGLHDLGKFTRSFQAKVPDLWPVEALGALPRERLFETPHWRATGHLLQLDPLHAEFLALFPALGGGEGALLAAVAGHHGRPPPDRDSERKSVKALWNQGEIDAVCMNAAAFAFAALRRLIEMRPLPDLDEDRAPALSWRLSGLVTLADWVGSDADYFPPQAIDMPLEDYWCGAQSAAGRALAAKGLTPRPPALTASLASLSPLAAASPRPMQSLAETLPLAEGPQLILIEDATGSGKTEAALLLAARMMAAGLGEGVYFALPTMATANAMHKRLEEIGPRLFTDGAGATSLILAHGKSRVSAALAALSARQGGDGEPTNASACNAWIADDRRRAFFADLGAGTIDQAFLAVLRKKHLTLRQYALAGRILIVDEAHSFDAYMNEEFRTLLHLHALNGGSAIVLSATLSLRARQALACGYYAGVGMRATQAKTAAQRGASLDYPLLTHWTAQQPPTERAVALDARLKRRVDVERLEDRATAESRALAAAARPAQRRRRTIHRRRRPQSDVTSTHRAATRPKIRWDNARRNGVN